MATCARSWFLSLILQRFSRSHKIWWQVLWLPIFRELHSQENWFEMVILYRHLPCFTSASTLLSPFRKLSMQILDFNSFAFLKIARKLCESTNLNLFFLAFRGCEERFNGSVEAGSSSVVVRISSSSSMKRCAHPICLRDDILDNSSGEEPRPVHLSPFIWFSNFA